MSKFTTIYHEARIELGLSVEEYCVADLIFILSSNPSNNVGGWCYMSKTNMGDQFGLSRRNVFNILTKLARLDLIERHDTQASFIRTTAKWFDLVHGAKIALPVQEVQSASAKSALDPSAKIAPYSNSNNSNIESNNKYTWEHEDELLTVELMNAVYENYPYVKKKTPHELRQDYSLMNKIRRLDHREANVIRIVIKWSQSDPFWKKNIRSVYKLRKQFDTLMVGAHSEVTERKSRVAVI